MPLINIFLQWQNLPSFYSCWPQESTRYWLSTSRLHANSLSPCTFRISQSQKNLIITQSLLNDFQWAPGFRHWKLINRRLWVLSWWGGGRVSDRNSRESVDLSSPAICWLAYYNWTDSKGLCWLIIISNHSMKSCIKVNHSYITLHSHALDIHIGTAGRLSAMIESDTVSP